MKLAAANALAKLVHPDQLSEEYIILSLFDKRVVEAASQGIARKCTSSKASS